MRADVRWAAVAATAAAAAFGGTGCAASRGRPAAPTAAAPASSAPRRGAPSAAADGDSVSVGYDTQTRRSLTSAVGSVDGSTGQRDGAIRVEEMLRRVPGVSVTRMSGGSYSVRVRNGGAKLSSAGGGGAGEPLFVLDGVPLAVGVGALDNLAPQDVERIDVLKDAEAAIYGSQGANGVVLIRTRRGPRR
jgi:TonB-dependent SusC/RagA subfamily outer membrane receptor